MEQWPEGLSAAQRNHVARITCDAWRELGFWYECDLPAYRWHVRADRQGVRRLAEAVRRFLGSPDSADPGAHLHLGPYSNLRIGRADTARVSWRGIEGRREDLARFVGELEAIAALGETGAHEIAAGFDGENGFSVRLTLEPDGFDPASPDPAMLLLHGS